MPKKTSTYLLATFLVFFVSSQSWSAEDKATVTYLEGSAFKTKDGKEWRPLSKGDTLAVEDTVKAGAGARLELTLPDKSKVRFSERTQLKIESLLFKKEERSLGIKVFLGRVWAKVTKAKKGSRFEIKTANAVAGVRGTTYRIDVNEDTSSLVRVYEGEVGVGSLPAGLESKGGGSKYIPGPSEVPGPHEVSREEWEYIVKSWQQITISPAGAASRPAPFKPEEDKDDWVIWNKDMDQSKL